MAKRECVTVYEGGGFYLLFKYKGLFYPLSANVISEKAIAASIMRNPVHFQFILKGPKDKYTGRRYYK